jgi:transposase-like protein
MPPKKLSDSDKQEILDRYCHSDETTVTLAAQFGVSTSTISRILKQSLPEQEYESLVHKKRQGSGKSQLEQEMLPGLPEELLTPELQVTKLFDEPEQSVDVPQRRQRKRSTAGMISAEQLAASAAHLSQLDLAPGAKKLSELDPQPEVLNPIQEASIVAAEDFAEEVEEEVEDEELDDELEDDLEDDLDDDLDDLDDELEDDEFDEAGTNDLASLGTMQSTGKLQILPLAEALIPRTCYVVVDRSSELITRPLKDFTELGRIPTEERQERTLPIFDNHRVAKRFLRRMQRIVKVPDGRIFQKVKPYLQAKGITHLLIDGQVYSLQ